MAKENINNSDRGGVEMSVETVNFETNTSKLYEITRSILDAERYINEIELDEGSVEDFRLIIKGYIETLKRAKKERLDLLEKLDEPNTNDRVYTFENNMIVNRKNLITEIQDIENIIPNEDDHKEDENTDTDMTEEAVVENTNEEFSYKSINEEIENYSKQLDNKVSDEEREEIQSFISHNIDHIQTLLNKDKTLDPDNQNDSLKTTLLSDLKKLERLNLKLNPANEIEKTAKPKFNKIDIQKNLTEAEYRILTLNPDFEQFKDSLFDLVTRYNHNIDTIDKNEKSGIDNKNIIQETEGLKIKINEIKKSFFEFGKTKYLEELKKQKTNETWSKFAQIKLNSVLLSHDIEILSTNPELQDKLLEAIKDYNEEIDKKRSINKVKQLIKQINTLKKEFVEYKYKHEEGLKKENNKKKKNNNKKDEDNTVGGDAENGETSESKNEPESKPEPETVEEDIEDEKIYNPLKPEGDYTEIFNDNGFDKWFQDIDKMLRENGANLLYERKDVEDWYREYKSALPYIEKLNTVFKDIENNSTTTIEKNGVKNKIKFLIYEIHTKGDIAKNAIDKIYKSYEKSKELENELEVYKKREELKEIIEKSKNKKGSYSRNVTLKQVQEVLESCGEENTAENLDELKDLLTDLHLNYDFYCSGTKEGEPNNIRRVYERYKTVGAKNETPKKITNWFSKLGKKMISSLSRSRDIDDYDKYNQFIDITRKVRELDLVDRKSGNTQKTEENKNSMDKLIRFIEDNADTLDKYLTDEKSIDIKNITSNADDEKLFKKAVDLYKTFVIGKYRTSEAKEKAMYILEQNESPDMSDSEPTIEMLYSDPQEKDLFEKNAEISINREHFLTIEKNIEILKKSKEKKIKEVAGLQDSFEKTKEILKRIGNTEDEERLKNIELKLSVLRLKHINTENLSDLSNLFPVYDKILSSKDIKKEEKTEYIKALIENLTKLKRPKDSTSNHTAYNAQLDAIIEKYNKYQ